MADEINEQSGVSFKPSTSQDLFSDGYNMKEKSITQDEIMKENDSESDIELNRTYETAPDNSFCEKSTAPSSSDSEWEDVENVELEDNDDTELQSEPVIPENGVEITLDPEMCRFNRKKKRKEFDWQNYVRLQLNRIKREQQIEIHKVNLLCYLARGIYVNEQSSVEVVLGLIMSLIPHQFLLVKPKKSELMEILGLTEWYHQNFHLVADSESDEVYIFGDKLMSGIECKKFDRKDVFVAGFLALLRLLGFECRLVTSIQTVPLKPVDLIKPKPENENEKTRKRVKRENSQTKMAAKSGTENSSTSAGTSYDTSDIDAESRGSRTLRKRKKSTKRMESESDSESEKPSSKKSRDVEIVITVPSDSDFEEEEPKFRRPRKTSEGKNKRRSKDLKADKDKNKISTDVWIEVFVEGISSWICVDVINNNVNCQSSMESVATNPLKYVLSFDNKGKVKDITQKYAVNWMSLNRKLRIDAEWWEITLAFFRPRLTKREKSENEAIETELVERPLPTTIGEFKSHPLYALQRHLLKFESIYPPDAVPIGFIRKEAIFDRKCVYTLHSRETWLKQAKVVKLGEIPYKTVKARPKWNKLLGQIEDAVAPLEIFGPWQTEDYVPPTAVDGKVPRNEYGNVELFQPCMLPFGTVHIQVPRLLKVANKLGIDCVPAMIGFENGRMGSRPVFDGWVVCEEHKDALMVAWREQMKIDRERITQKREQRIYGNWKKLIRLLVIRERINTKYLKINEK